MEFDNIKKSFGDTKIVNDFSYIFKKGEKIGVIGKNGVGKSTFLNMVMNLDVPDSGNISTGETIVFGYYSQEGLKQNEDKRVIDVVKDIAEFIPLADGSKLSASGLLTKFLFPPSVQFGFVSKLSGGERRRLYLMTILITNPNFLILDEPTNDLDIVTLSVLEDFLTSFPGCLLVVTHDRCEKASAYLKHHGFKDVSQLQGGIIDYVRQIKAENLPSKFIGKNFVFDERVGERITDDIIAQCHQCGAVCDTHVNCANDDCHLLFIQCESCFKNTKGCCTAECMHIADLPIEEQRSLRKGRKKTDCLSVYKSRLRPNLKEILDNKSLKG